MVINLNCILICTNGVDLDLVQCLIASIHDNYHNHPEIVLVTDTEVTIGGCTIIKIPRLFSCKKINTNNIPRIHNEEFHSATLLRFRAIDILFKKYDKILYLDTDIIVLDNLDELFELDCPLSGALNYDFSTGCDEPPFGSTYINAGVLLINKTIHAAIGRPSLYEDYESTDLYSELMDQDYLNNLPLEINILPQTYNFVPANKKILPMVKILHFCCIKPWSGGYFNCECMELLLKYLPSDSNKTIPIIKKLNNIKLINQVCSITGL